MCHFNFFKMKQQQFWFLLQWLCMKSWVIINIKSLRNYISQQLDKPQTQVTCQLHQLLLNSDKYFLFIGNKTLYFHDNINESDPSILHSKHFTPLSLNFIEILKLKDAFTICFQIRARICAYNFFICLSYMYLSFFFF